MRNLITAVLLGVACLITTGPAAAGTTGTLRVYIRDQATGQPAPYTNVYLQSEDFLASRLDSPPFASFLNLEPGRYFLTIQYEMPLIGGCYAHLDIGADEDISTVVAIRPIPPNVLGDPSPCSRAGSPGVSADVYDIF